MISPRPRLNLIGLVMVAAISVLTSCPEGSAMTRGRTAEGILERVLSPDLDAPVELWFTTPEVTLKPGQLCLRISYRSNLAACLETCDGKTRIPLTPEPSYPLIGAALDDFAWTGRLEIDLSIEKNTLPFGLRLKTKSKKGGIELSNSPKEPNLCSTDFDGLSCLKRVQSRLIGVLDKEPIQAYENLLGEFARGLPRDEWLLLTRMASEVRAIRMLLDRAGKASYETRAGFLKSNIRSAPTFLCQLASRGSLASAESQALNKALNDSLMELDSSMDFLSREATDPTGVWSSEKLRRGNP